MDEGITITLQSPIKAQWPSSGDRKEQEMKASIGPLGKLDWVCLRK